MTNVQEELTMALERRAEAVAVENRLDAILDHHNIIRFSNDKGADPRRNRLLVIAASVVVVLGVGGLLWADRSRTQPPASSSAPTPVDTSPDATWVSTPSFTPATIPTEFPSDVPRPDSFQLMQFITADSERVGWEFFDQRDPTDSVERCTEYASSFDSSWTATPKTDEHASVTYAQILDNGQWQVGIYCTNDGGYLVQVMPTNTSFPLTADTVPPVATMPVTISPETSSPGWVAPAATLPALTDVSSVVPPTVLGTGPTDWYRLQPDLDVAWYSDGGDQSMLCFRTPAGQDCQLDRFAPTASGGGPIGVRSVDDQLLVVTLDPASPVTVRFDNGHTVTRPFELDDQIGWGVARVQMPPAGTPEGLSMLFETAPDGSSSSAPPMTTVPTSEPVTSTTG
jgi:hypothetical protein